MIFDVITLFPEMFASPLQASILGRAIEQGLLQVRPHNLRDWAEGKHRTTDAPPYGGGDGMVMKPEPVARAVAAVKQVAAAGSRVLLMTPQGRPFRQQDARQLAGESGLIFICGRYEGFDERIRSLVDDELSLGDFVVTGGELPALVMIDAIARHLPGVLGAEGSAEDDSFSEGLLEYPQYTRPAVFKGLAVPEVLLSGDHGRIARWRREQQLIRTWQRRPELLAGAALSAADRALLEQLAGQQKTEAPLKNGGDGHDD